MKFESYGWQLAKISVSFSLSASFLWSLRNHRCTSRRGNVFGFRDKISAWLAYLHLSSKFLQIYYHLNWRETIFLNWSTGHDLAYMMGS